jgi:hypothetical protein
MENDREADFKIVSIQLQNVEQKPKDLRYLE